VTDTFESILSRRLSRRGLLGAGLLAVPAAIVPAALTHAAQVESRTAAGSLGFKAIAGSRADAIRVAEGHTSQVVIRWGDALLPGARPIDTSSLAAGALSHPVPRLRRSASSATTATPSRSIRLIAAAGAGFSASTTSTRMTN